MLQLGPERIVGPVVRRVGQRYLDVIAAQYLRAHRAQRKAALVLDVDQLGRGRFGARQNAEPAEWIDLLVLAQFRFRDRGPADAVGTIGAYDVIAIDADE